jgi:putative membrane protein
MRNPVTLVIVVVLAVVAAVILVRAANRPDTADETGYMTERDAGAGDAAPLAAADLAFVTRAAESGNAEVDLAQLAQRTSEHAQIDALAEQIERDHEQANEQLSDLADRRDVDFPNTAIGLPGPTEEQQATYDRLDELEGAAFDQAWLDQMARSHEASIEAYTTASKSTDPDVKAYAEKTLPVIRHHLEQIESVQKTVKAPQQRR